MTTGTRRFLGWLAASLIGLLIAGYITNDQFAALMQPIVSLFVR